MNKKMKFIITCNAEGMYFIYKRRWFSWWLVSCATDLERAYEKIDNLKFIKHVIVN